MRARLRRLAVAVLPLALLVPLARLDGAPRPPGPGPSARSATVAGAWDGVARCLSAPTSDPAARAASELNLLARAYPHPSEEVGGYRLVGQPSVGLNAFRTLMARNPTAVRGPARKPDCRDLVCAASAAFGPDLGPTMMLLAVDYQLAPVLEPRSSGLRWTAAELREVLAAADDLPPSLFPLREEEYRSLILVDAKALPLIAAGRIFAISGETATAVRLSTLWRSAPPSERRATIVHEFAHDFTRARGMFLNWRRLWAEAQADDAREAAARGEGAQPVSAYAATNLDEDFAESVTAYRYMPEVLRRGGAHRYVLLRQWIFDELEYGSDSQCAPDRARSWRAERMAVTLLRLSRPSSEDLADAAVVCAGQADPRLCSVRFFYIRAYRKAWYMFPAAMPIAAMAAIDGQRHATGLVNRAVARLPPSLVDTLVANGASPPPQP